MVMFRREDRARVSSGEITVTFRLWKTAKVRAGKRYRTMLGAMEILNVQVLPAASIPKKDVPRTGCTSVRAIWDLAGEHTGSHVGPDTLLYRVEFRLLRDAATADDRPPALSLEELGARLDKMDRLSTRGAWTTEVLRLIADAQRAPARVLAGHLGWDTPDFKSRVRRLKALGLTVSHEVGYELSELGRAYLAAHSPVNPSRRAGRGRSRRTR